MSVAAPPASGPLVRFVAVLWSGAAWKRMLYLALSFPLGLAWFVVLVTGLALGFGLAITIAGLPLLVALLFGWRALAALERQAAALLLEVDIEASPLVAGTPGSGAWPRLKANLTDPLTWKGLGYLLLRFPMGLVSFVVLVTGVSVAAAFLAAPFLTGIDHVQIGAWQVDTLPEALVLFAVGALLVPVLLYVSALGVAWGVIAKAMLSPATRPTPPQPQPGVAGYDVAVLPPA